MEDFSKNGRKLRPRKTAEGPAYSTSPSFHRERSSRPYGESRPYNSNGDYSERRPRNERGTRPQSSDRPQGGRRFEGSNRTNDGYRSNEGYRSNGDNRRQGGNFRTEGGFRSEGGSYRSDNKRPNTFSKGGFHKPGYGKSSYGKPAYGKPGFKKNYGPSASEEGINRMLSRKPVISEMQNNSDNDYVKTPIQEEVRLNKFIANSGVCSRREADTLIQAGVVTVNGEVVTELGTKVNIYKDEIKFNGERLKGEEKVYLVMNKPKGYVTTASDPHAEKTVMELLKGCTYRVFPVGRLDKNTTGVLMFTNDGELAEKLTHPSYDKKKIYQVNLDKPLQQEDHDKILSGVELSDGRIAADELEFIDADDHRKLGIEIHSGRNRIVRRIFESLGYEVKSLDRVYFAGLTKKGLKKGEWRRLSEGEVNILKMGAYV